jgi:hypothetical protein
MTTMETEKKYVIAWKSKKTDFEGQGETLFTFESATIYCEELNNDFPFLEHWPKKVIE